MTVMAEDALLRRIAGDADLDEVKQWLIHLTAKQEECRFELGHSWHRHKAYRAPGGYVRIVKCSRCQNKRKRLYQRGRIVSADYIPAEGFAAPKGIGHFTADDLAALREILFERELAEQEAKEAAAAAGKTTRGRKAA
jgi:hypothetical protein